MPEKMPKSSEKIHDCSILTVLLSKLAVFCGFICQTGLDQYTKGSDIFLQDVIYAKAFAICIYFNIDLHNLQMPLVVTNSSLPKWQALVILNFKLTFFTFLQFSPTDPAIKIVYKVNGRIKNQWKNKPIPIQYRDYPHYK